MVNIYDSANQVAQDLEKTPQFEALKKSLESLKNNPESMKLYGEMDALQKKVMAAQQAGQPLSDDIKKEYNEINAKVSNNDDLKDMISKEQAVFQLVNDVQTAITKPLSDLYKDLESEK